MRPAARTHQPVVGDSTALRAKSVLKLAIINNAKVLGLAECGGSLEIVKKADFVVVDMDGVHLQWWFPPVNALVYWVTGGDMRLAVEAGKGELVTMDGEEGIVQAQVRSKELMELAGLREKGTGTVEDNLIWDGFG